MEKKEEKQPSELLYEEVDYGVNINPKIRIKNNSHISEFIKKEYYMNNEPAEPISASYSYVQSISIEQILVNLRDNELTYFIRDGQMIPYHTYVKPTEIHRSSIPSSKNENNKSAK